MDCFNKFLNKIPKFDLEKQLKDSKKDFNDMIKKSRNHLKASFSNKRLPIWRYTI